MPEMINSHHTILKTSKDNYEIKSEVVFWQVRDCQAPTAAQKIEPSSSHTTILRAGLGNTNVAKDPLKAV